MNFLFKNYMPAPNLRRWTQTKTYHIVRFIISSMIKKLLTTKQKLFHSEHHITHEYNTFLPTFETKLGTQVDGYGYPCFHRKSDSYGTVMLRLLILSACELLVNHKNSLDIRIVRSLQIHLYCL